MQHAVASLADLVLRSGLMATDPGRKRPSHAPRTLAGDEHPHLAQQVMRKLKAPHRPVLVVLTGDELGTRVVVDRSLVIGRAPEADLTLSDQLISWHHARIEDRGDGWALFDLESTNGTTVNGETKAEFLLQPSDRIVFGATAVSFEKEDALQVDYNEAVERLVNIDDLSGLFVRRKFDADLAALLDAARGAKEPLSLLVMDMDGIKKINDTHGHLFGAHVIGQAGHIIGTIIEGRGIGCRFGGDEYLAALPKLDADAATAIADSILRAVNTTPFVKDGVTLKPGISIGLAAFPAHADDAEALFQRADEALYRAKHGGRNRISR
jgi:two-component system, cell cycle response regulator